ncbi:MAG: 2-C-methyl-D-erythritol 4-phosphate cytidylyltransferase [Butyrivibrio sp.]|uniref:IspD/TarI family cytidylyltransferase n=1 Tax=Butyrivibrio sp. TaxID=28121 RepID=UPI0025C31C33|nr:IspD/TarI family cytidylyltransferase [Butyrivibrio sp.]MBQ6589049.1 2-C-methyl-D-erythritol 4-phosphate cytidylyltransferase [Butyrivibrio sp.]
MNIAIILAGGTGSRLGGDMPKQFLELSGQMMILHSMRAFAESEYVGNIQIVADKAYREKIEDAMFEDTDSPIGEKFLGFSDPGENRQLSIYNAMKDIGDMLGKETIDGIIIHDAARPFVTKETVDECLLALDQHDGAMPVIPMNDTVYFSRSGQKVDELLNRNHIYAGQAPEAFWYDKYLKANEDLLPDKILMIKGSTEVAIMAGMDVAMIPGDQRNFKITTKEDMERAIHVVNND